MADLIAADVVQIAPPDSAAGAPAFEAPVGPHRVMSYPFRLAPSGAVELVAEGSDASNAELIAVLILTRKGERELVPAFGVEDPSFAELTFGEVLAGLELYGPDVELRDVVTRYPTPTTAEADVIFD